MCIAKCAFVVGDIHLLKRGSLLSAESSCTHNKHDGVGELNRKSSQRGTTIHGFQPTEYRRLRASIGGGDTLLVLSLPNDTTQPGILLSTTALT
jgi:hypothetical protein